MNFLLQIKKNISNIDLFFYRPKVKIASFTLVVLVVFIFIVNLNLIQPFFFDDWVYAFVHRDLSTTDRITCISDIFYSQYDHYFTWGGRTVAHFIAQLLILIGNPCARILNSIAYIVFIYVIYLHARGAEKKTIDISLFVLINILVWFFQVDYSRATLWLTGSANYLWCTLIILLFLLPYRFLIDRDSKSSALKTILFFLLGIIAGWTNENMAGAMIFMVVCLLAYLFFYKHSIPKWAYAGLVGAIIGFLIMILAPGNYVRYEAIVNNWHAGEISKMDQYIGGLTRVLSGMFFFLLGILGLFSVLCVLYYFVSANKKRKKIIFLALLYLGTALVAAFAMIFSPTFPGRAWFGIITFIIVGVGVLYAHIDTNITLFKALKYTLFPFWIIALVGFYFQAYNDMDKVNKVYLAREKFILEQKKHGVQDFVFNYDVHPAVSINYLHDLYNDPNNWHNANYARYYGVRSVKINRPESE